MTDKPRFKDYIPDAGDAVEKFLDEVYNIIVVLFELVAVIAGACLIIPCVLIYLILIWVISGIKYLKDWVKYIRKSK